MVLSSSLQAVARLPLPLWTHQRWWSLALAAGLLLSSGCQTSPNDDGDPLPDDDDSGAVGDDDTQPGDDDTLPGDDDTGDDDSGDDDTGDDDSGDDDTGDDDSALEACEPQALLDASCVELAYEEPQLAVGLQSCPDGDYVFTSLNEWQDFLGKCGLSFDPASDPFASHDWATRALVAVLRTAKGCNPVGQVLWFVQCIDGFHLGNAFRVCGDCATELFVARFVTVPLSFVPVQVESCLPADLTCD